MERIEKEASLLINEERLSFVKGRPRLTNNFSPKNTNLTLWGPRTTALVEKY
jgi:hypothetical protein